MTAMVEERQAFAADFAALQERNTVPAWLRGVREAARARFTEVGFPTTRDEEWRFTNLEPITSRTFAAAPAAPGRLAARDLARFGFEGLQTCQLVFVDGRFAPGLSSVHGLPPGVVVCTLSEALRKHADVVRAHLTRYADIHLESFTALNTAFIEEGAFVHVPRGKVVETPVHLLFVSTAASEGVHSHPRNLVVAEESTELTVFEDYVSTDECTYFTNAITEVVAGDNSVVSHYLIERESAKAFNISTLRVQQGRSSNFASHSVLLGGALVRNNVHPVLAGEGCESLLNGLYVLGGTQHADNHMRVEHAAAHCDSRQFYKGILEGRSRAVFAGRIIVHKGAQKTDAKQTNKNLLLSDESLVDSKPQLEIYADDVKCTHGATIGQLDEDALFYLRSRGLHEQTARAILVYAFARESLDRMKVEPIRRGLTQALLARLPNAELLQGIA